MKYSFMAIIIKINTIFLKKIGYKISFINSNSTYIRYYIYKFLLNKIVSANPRTPEEATNKFLYLVALISSSRAELNENEISTALETLLPYREFMQITKSTRNIDNKMD